MLKRIVLTTAMTLALAATLPAQGPGGPRGFRDWWDGPMAEGLNLSETQRTQIQSTLREYRNRMVDARAALEKAEGNLDDFFNTEGTTDPRRANEAIDRLAAARAELTKVVSQMSLKLRGVLTAQQWQELQRRGPGRGPGRFDGKIGPDGGPPGLRRFGSAGRPPNGQQSGQQKGPNPPPPPASQPSPPPAKPPAP